MGDGTDSYDTSGGSSGFDSFLSSLEYSVGGYLASQQQSSQAVTPLVAPTASQSLNTNTILLIAGIAVVAIILLK